MSTGHAGGYTRRQVVGCLVSAAAIGGGCTPVRLNVFRYFDEDDALIERTLSAFVAAVVPGVPLPDPSPTRVFADDFYPFAPHRRFFAADLCRRAGERHGERYFDRLDLPGRTAVITEGLQSDPETRQLYEGAILLTHIAVYGGVYAADAAVPSLGFEGAGRVPRRDAISYPEPQRFLARPLTASGNHD